MSTFRPHPRSRSDDFHLTSVNSHEDEEQVIDSALQARNSISSQRDINRGFSFHSAGRRPSNRYLVKPVREGHGNRRLIPHRFSDYEQSIAEESTAKHSAKKGVDEQGITCWDIFVYGGTFFLPDALLNALGKTTDEMRRAFRDKLALCYIIVLLCALVGFLSFGMNPLLCPHLNIDERMTLAEINNPVLGIRNNYVFAKGKAYKVQDFANVYKINPDRDAGKDFTFDFLVDLNSQCPGVTTNFFSLACPDFPFCQDPNQLQNVSPNKKNTFLVSYEYTDIKTSNNSLITYFNGNILDLTPYFQSNSTFLGAQVDSILRAHLRLDCTHAIKRVDPSGGIARCLTSIFTVGFLNKDTPGCFLSKGIMIFISILIVLLTGSRFIGAVVFNYYFSARLDVLTKRYKISYQSQSNQKEMEKNYPYTAILVTCYSEDEESIKGTLDSLAHTDYFDEYKMLFIVCDGIVTGSGNAKSTPDIVKGLIQILPGYEDLATPQSYVAVADGPKRHNKARVYPGHYVFHNRHIPVILVEKCGTEEEKDSPKPGNRGKRDSQIILMNMFKTAFFDEPMTPLDYDLFVKINELVGVPPSSFEIVLMVDADTRVDTESLSRMVAAMQQDPLIMGLCGETRISNKRTSWVTRIQVFEYYISHHLGKAFESAFGGVTCLPGCFCMYRLKSPKNGVWVPVLINPDIVAEYSENVVTTLHQKNLLLLGEDRFLTTLMLKTFPHRKMIFVPQAICRTTVPDTYKVLNSQRRRWINSTIHNLMELALIRNLCGIFCFSMQFIIVVELIGTAVLPAALFFTFLMIITFAITPGLSILPLIILLMIVFLPALLVLLTTRKWIYLYWFAVYLVALPIWNFALPLYAFWHQDDFSWGATRPVQGLAAKDDHHGGDGKKEKIDYTSQVPHRKWFDWRRQTREFIADLAVLNEVEGSGSSANRVTNINNEQSSDVQQQQQVEVEEDETNDRIN